MSKQISSKFNTNHDTSIGNHDSSEHLNSEHLSSEHLSSEHLNKINEAVILHHEGIKAFLGKFDTHAIKSKIVMGDSCFFQVPS